MERCVQCHGPLGHARVTVRDDGTGFDQVCGPKCEKDFAAGEEKTVTRLTTADDLDLAAGQADIEAPW